MFFSMTSNNCRGMYYPKNSVFSRQKREILHFVTVLFSLSHFLIYITVIVDSFSSSVHSEKIQNLPSYLYLFNKKCILVVIMSK